MRTLTGLYGSFFRKFVAVIFITALLGTGSASALGGQLFGLALGIDFGDDHLVSGIEVQVAKGWLNSDNFSLAISIDGLNHGDHSHGYQEVPLSATEILGTERDLAYVLIDWDTDTLIPSTPEDYTACVQILVNGNAIGGELCSWVGEF